MNDNEKVAPPMTHERGSMTKIIHTVTINRYSAKAVGCALRLVLGTYGSYGIEKLQIHTDETWDGLLITANFVTRNGVTSVVVPSSGLIDVPPEATEIPGDSKIVIDGTDESRRIYTVNLPYMVIAHADIESGAPPAPTPDRWQQFVAQVKEYSDSAASSATASAASAKQAKDAAASVSGAVEAVEDAETKALQDIDTAKTGAVQGVQEAQESGVLAVQDAEHKAVGAVNDTADTREQKLNDIASHPPVPNLETGKWQVWDAESGAYVDTEAEYQGEKGDTGLGLPTPTTEDKGKVPVVNAAGDGYELGNAQVDAYTKAESDARYAPIEAAIRPTVSGNPATLEHSVAWAIQGLNVYGKSTQDGTPSPDSPVPIVSAGESGSIAVSISDGADQSQQLVISTPNGLPGIPVSSGGNWTDENGQAWVADVVDQSGTTKNVVAVVLDGTESVWDAASSGAQWQYYEITGAKIVNAYMTSETPWPWDTAARSNYFIPGNPYSKSGDVVAVLNQNSITKIRIGFSDAASFSSTQSVKAWLAERYQLGNPVIVMYPAKVTTVTPLADEELSAYAALRTYDSTTVVSTDAPVAGLSARYVADGAAYIESKIQAAVTQAVAAAVSLTGGQA